ncbi:MAG: class III extradiol ring-cleavage dioxygenase [Rhodocyclaceae bacterium]|nr:class III extradiol ring-cleavage dioxygenase [Rhodocyclaceae bacterium]
MSSAAILSSPLFVPHGAPTFALRPGAAGAALSRVAAALPRPRAVIVVSAHWDTEAPTVGLADRPETIHDYWGFPRELYAIRYPATGCKEAGADVLARLRQAGFAAAGDGGRGLDHGAWIPLRLMFPEADVPVIPLSIQAALGAAHHLAVGAALAPLAARGFLLVASGNLTHNLRDFQAAAAGAAAPPAYVREFPDWIWQRLQAADLPALLDYRRQAPAAVRAHPSDEHLLPLFVALGAAGEGARTERFHAGVDDYVMAMDAFAFHPRAAKD